MQRQRYHRIKSLIEKAAPKLGGLFYSYDVFSSKTCFVDAYFLDKFPIFYNCTFLTTKLHYRDAIEDLAMDESRKILEYPNGWAEWNSLETKQNDLEAFGGISRFDWINRRSEEIIDEGKIIFAHQIKLEYDYADGIGLTAILDEPVLTVDILNEFIRKYEGDSMKTLFLCFSNEDLKGIYDVNAVQEPW